MRRTAFSASNIHDFVSKDAVFMNKISKALTTIHENYGHKAVQDCFTPNQATGEAEIDLDVLCAMLDRSQSKLKSECCAMFFHSKSIIGSFMYLFGSLLFGAVTYFNEKLDIGIKTFFGILATTFYLIGGILFIVAAIEPYWMKTLAINEVANDVKGLKQRGDIVKQMSGKKSFDASVIKARMSKLSVDTKSLLSPNEIEKLRMEQKALKRQKTTSFEEPSCSSSKDIFDMIAEEQTLTDQTNDNDITTRSRNSDNNANNNQFELQI